MIQAKFLIQFILLIILISLYLKKFSNAEHWGDIKEYITSPKMKNYFSILFWGFILLSYLHEINIRNMSQVSQTNLFVAFIAVIFYILYLKKIFSNFNSTKFNEFFRITIFLFFFISQFNWLFLDNFTEIIYSLYNFNIGPLFVVFYLYGLLVLTCGAFHSSYNSWDESR